MLPSRAVVAAVAWALSLAGVEAGLGDPQGQNHSETAKFKHTMQQAIATDRPRTDEGLQDHSHRGHEDNDTALGESLLQEHSHRGHRSDDGPNDPPTNETEKNLDTQTQEDLDTEQEKRGVFGSTGGPGPHFGVAIEQAGKQLKAAGEIQEKAGAVQHHMKDAAKHLNKYHEAVLGLNGNLKELDTVQESVNPLLQLLKEQEAETVAPVDATRFDKYTSALEKAQKDIEDRLDGNDED